MIHRRARLREEKSEKSLIACGRRRAIRRHGFRPRHHRLRRPQGIRHRRHHEVDHRLRREIRHRLADVALRILHWAVEDDSFAVPAAVQAGHVLELWAG